MRRQPLRYHALTAMIGAVYRTRCMIYGLVKDTIALLQPEDRRRWVTLLAAAIISGSARSLFLALINSAASTHLHEADIVIYGAGALVLAGLTLTADFFSAVQDGIDRRIGVVQETVQRNSFHQCGLCV